MRERAAVKIYHGYGHTHDLVVYGHVFKKLPAPRRKYTSNIFSNIVQLMRLFFVKPLPHTRVRLIWYDQLLESITETDGFFKFEWQATHEIAAGWHRVTVQSLDKSGAVTAKGEGLIFVPHSTQYAFISDIDDTIMISHSATVGKRLKELFIHNPHTRSMFSDTAWHYALLAASHTTPQAPNPFFYVSSSEWNLYDYLHDFFDYNSLPEGAFLLNQVKRWYQLGKTGKTRHEGKLLRIARIFEAFPRQRFILFGDNSQSDPAIYARLAEKYTDRVFAVYIRDINPGNHADSRQWLQTIEARGIHTFLFAHSQDAISHSRLIGLITDTRISANAREGQIVPQKKE